MHDQEIPKGHSICDGFPHTFTSAAQVEDLLHKLCIYNACIGNNEEDFHPLWETTCRWRMVTLFKRIGLQKSVLWPSVLSSRVNIVCCCLTVCCIPYRQLRSRLRAQCLSQEQKPGVSKCKANAWSQTRKKKKILRKWLAMPKIFIGRCKRTQAKVNMCEDNKNWWGAAEKGLGECLGQWKTVTLMWSKCCLLTHFKAYFSSNSWSTIHCVRNKAWDGNQPSSGGVYIRSKSGKAYNGLRLCQHIPHDYTHYNETGTRFHPGVLEQLITEAKKKCLYDKDSSKYVGIITRWGTNQERLSIW